MTDNFKKEPPDFILASGSPRRKKLLPLLGLRFRTQRSKITETYDDNEPAAQIVQRLAQQKGRAVATQNKSAIILGADTLVIHRETVLGKPENKSQARNVLQKLSGSTHSVLTGLALFRTDMSGKISNMKNFYESTRVTFGTLTEAQINRYVETGSPLDKAGAYGIQDEGAIFVKRIEGDYYNIVGLPLHALYNHLKTFAPELWQ